MNFRFQWNHDDSCFVYLGDVFICDVSYDAYGRFGMTQVLKAIRRIATAYSAEVIEIEPWDEDYS